MLIWGILCGSWCSGDAETRGSVFVRPGADALGNIGRELFWKGELGLPIYLEEAKVPSRPLRGFRLPEALS